MKKKSLLITFLLILLLVTACDLTGRGVEPTVTTLPPTQTQPTTQPPLPTNTAEPSPTATKPQPTADLTATAQANAKSQVQIDVEALLVDNSLEGQQALSDYLAANLAEQRGLEFTQFPAIRKLSEEEYMAVLNSDYPLESDNMIALEAVALDSLGLLDFEQIESTWGMRYDNMFKAIISLDKDSNFIYFDLYEMQPEIKLIYYLLWNSKALIHQNWEIEPYLGNFYEHECFEGRDACLAKQAVLFGDMINSTSVWIEQNTSGKLKTTMRSMLQQMIEIGKEDIIYAQNSSFINLAGYEFVKQIIKEGGYEALNAVYENLPVSTEQIYHPERYPDDQPRDVKVPDPGPEMPARFSSAGNEIMGELYLYTMLSNGYRSSTHLNEAQSAAAVDGWGGDHLRMFLDMNSLDRGTVMATVWDSPEEMQEARAGFEAWLEIRLGPKQDDGTYRNADYGAAILEYGEDGFVMIITNPPSILADFIKGFDPATVEGW